MLPALIRRLLSPASTRQQHSEAPNLNERSDTKRYRDTESSCAIGQVLVVLSALRNANPAPSTMQSALSEAQHWQLLPFIRQVLPVEGEDGKNREIHYEGQREPISQTRPAKQLPHIGCILWALGAWVYLMASKECTRHGKSP